MYCAGHLIQAAVALHRGRGRRAAARRRRAPGRPPGARVRGPGAGPGRAPGDRDRAGRALPRDRASRAYLDLARQFVDQRGQGLAGELRHRPPLLPGPPAGARDGHRGAGTRCAQLYLEAGVPTWTSRPATRRCSSARCGAGTTWWPPRRTSPAATAPGTRTRRFGDRYELPPDRAYNETCAAIASFQWSWRLLLATGDAPLRRPDRTHALQRLRRRRRHRRRAVLLRQPAAAPRRTTSRGAYPGGAASGSTAPAARRTSCASSPRWAATSPPTDDTGLYVHQYMPGTGWPAASLDARGHHRLPVVRRGLPAGRSTRRRTRAGWRCGCPPGAPAPGHGRR